MLTGLANRTKLMERTAQAISQAERYEQPLALLFIDLDNFKHVNDMFGHEVGDELLKVIAFRLAARTRSGEIVARLGGDEFVVLLEDVRNPEEVTETIDRLIEELQQPVVVAEQVFHPQASIGIAMYPQDAKSQEICCEQLIWRCTPKSICGKPRTRRSPKWCATRFCLASD